MGGRFVRRLVTLYLPLVFYMVILLFPFYWMFVTSVKPNAELLDLEVNPLWVRQPTLEHIRHLLVNTPFLRWLGNTTLIAVGSTVISLAASLLSAYAIQRLRFRGSSYLGLAVFMAYMVPPTILFIPLALVVLRLNLFDNPWALILTYPTFLIPFATWMLMGYFKSIPKELEECAAIDGASRFTIFSRIIIPVAVPGILSATIFSFTLSWNEYIYALVFLSTRLKKTVPVAVVTELVRGDVFAWGPLMAGALLGSLPVALVYSLFVEHYVAGMTGSLKE